MKALLVVDVQNHLVAKKLYRKGEFLANVKSAIAEYRKSGDLIVFIQHNSKSIPHGSSGWRIYDDLDVRETDPVVQKEHGNSFEDTELKGILAKQGIKQVLVCGLVTHGCVRATSIGAMAEGLKVKLLKGAHSNWAANAKGRIAAVEKELKELGVATVELGS